MGLKRVGLNILQKIRKGVNTNALTPATNTVFRTERQAAGDTFKAISKISFEDLYNVIKLNNSRIRIIPKMSEFNGRNLIPFEMPEYLYHITSETNMNLIRSSNTLKVSPNEQLPGVYLLDKENFLTRYLCVGDKKRNLCKSILTHANDTNKDSSNLVVIRIPVESLLRNGKLRIRTQEDFFYYQDVVYRLQKGLKKKFSLRMLYNDNYRAQFEKYILDNGLMTKQELEQLMQEMKQKIHYGYKCSQLTQLEKHNAVEYIFNHDISPDTIKGIKCKRFSIDECMDSKTGTINIEALKRILG